MTERGSSRRELPDAESPAELADTGRRFEDHREERRRAFVGGLRDGAAHRDRGERGADVHEQQDTPEALPMPLNAFPAWQEIRSYADRVPSLDGFYDVGCHGDAHQVEAALDDGRTELLDHRGLAQLLRERQDYTGEGVRLLSCSTGAPEGRFAQGLADELGADVMAPTDTLWIFRNGRTTIGPSPFVNTGTWVTFRPSRREQ